MSAAAILFLALLAAASGALVGFVFGRENGRDAQWVDDFIAAGKRERERRDARGRFKVKGGA